MLTTINYTSDSLMQNVSNEFKEKTAAEVRAILAPKRTELVNVCMNFTNDFNKSSIIRSSNAFTAKEVILVGKRRFNRRGTTGIHHLETIKHAETLAEAVEYLHASGYVVYAVDNIPEFNPTELYKADFPEKTAFVYPEEFNGFTAEDVALCDGVIYIPTYGGVPRTVNVAQIGTILMSEYNRRHLA